MAKLTSTEIAQQEAALYEKCADLYRKVLPAIETLGWEVVVIAADEFAVYSRMYDGEEYILNIDVLSALVRGESTVHRQFEWEIKALPEWIALEEAVDEWRGLDFPFLYWDY